MAYYLTWVHLGSVWHFLWDTTGHRVPGARHRNFRNCRIYQREVVILVSLMCCRQWDHAGPLCDIRRVLLHRVWHSGRCLCLPCCPTRCHPISGAMGCQTSTTLKYGLAQFHFKMMKKCQQWVINELSLSIVNKLMKCFLLGIEPLCVWKEAYTLPFCRIFYR